MAREKECFREVLESLHKMFPNKVAITLKEASEVTETQGATLLNDSTFPAKKVGGKWLIPVVKFAHWLS